ncbi:MAG: DUF1634 domain-containing protein [Magnetococcales bacterium]|nr:DUF1634 domain-containing protein [Magnetococcales bacterium]MBF0150775.1 DUF1634 domain-containing protein [Magnetococcales bacterium]MBF0173285.1 DUF1634 domain-containing protein [Magnetococcales bacterium]MBF0348137.1 DUF1634 domain-containing protein [Magnetococcales bacterium]MBF0630123.1 DUF1634 domain-containing protein [Magnetococcales bacterium]
MAEYKFDPKYASEEQLAYAHALDIGWKIGFGLMVIFFGLYVFGILTPHVSMEDLARYWTLPANEYLHAVHGPTGWGWTALVDKGDYINLVGIAVLAGITILCFMRVLPMFLKKGEKIYSAIIVVEIMVLILAASGILGGGGH